MLSLTIRWFYCVILIITITSCSSTPETQYYALAADKTPLALNHSLDKKTAIGIGPLVVPDILDNFSIISSENNNQIALNSFNLWAGNLKNNIGQVLADNISNYLDIDSVWAFPWDNRNRPLVQVRVVFERFSGQLGKNITLQAKWTMLTDYGKKEKITKKYRVIKTLDDDSYLSYVKGLNDALTDFSIELAKEVSRQ
ncbi:MAG: PqiC family protein [Cellvibrionaceae bacterium]